jgi:hypothetical protein
MNYSYMLGFIVCAGGFTLVCLALKWLFRGGNVKDGREPFKDDGFLEVENNPSSLRYNKFNVFDEL